MSDPPYSQPFVESIPSSINFKYIPGAVYAYAFSTIGNSLSQYNKDELGTNLTTLSVNPVYTPPTGTTETLSLTNELLRWDNLAVGSLVVAGNVTKGSETAQVITCSGEVITVPNKLFINNLVDTNDFIGQEGYFLTTDSNSIPMWTSNLPLTVNPIFSTIVVSQSASISSLSVQTRLQTTQSTITVLGPTFTYSNCSITAGVGANLITTTGSHTATTGSFTTNSGNITTTTGNHTSVSGSYVTVSGNHTTSNGNFSATTGSFTTGDGSFTTTTGSHTTSNGNFVTSVGSFRTPFGTVSSLTMSARTLTISTINNLPVSAYIPTTAYTTNLLASAPTTSAVPIASTIITTTTDGNILATANVGVVSLASQYHNTYLNLAINNQVSPSTFFTAPDGIGHYGNASLTFRATVSTGTHTIVAYQSAEQAGVMTTATVNLTGMGNLN